MLMPLPVSRMRPAHRATRVYGGARAAGVPDGRLPLRRPVIVEFDIPGVEPASIELTVEQNVLTVRAGRRFEPQQGDEVTVAERPQGTYARQVFLGDALDSERLQANCRHGVLTLRIPVAEAAKPRRVPVDGGQDAQTSSPLTAGGAEAGPAGQPVSTAGDAVPRAARAEPPIQLQLPDAAVPAAAEEGRAVSAGRWLTRNGVDTRHFAPYATAPFIPNSRGVPVNDGAR